METQLFSSVIAPLIMLLGVTCFIAAVNTSLAIQESFLSESVSEDSHTRVRYAEHPGKFVFLCEIKSGYRICSHIAGRSRSNNANFYQKMFEVDSVGFEEAVKIARKYGTMGGLDENDIRTAFYVRWRSVCFTESRYLIVKSH